MLWLREGNEETTKVIKKLIEKADMTYGLVVGANEGRNVAGSMILVI